MKPSRVGVDQWHNHTLQEAQHHAMENLYKGSVNQPFNDAVSRLQAAQLLAGEGYSSHRGPGSGYDVTSCPVPARQTVTVDEACAWDLGRATWKLFTLDQRYANLNLGIITASA